MLPELMIHSVSNSSTLVDLKQGLDSTFMTITLDNEGFIINCNQNFLNTSQWTPKRVIGKTFWQLFPNTDESEKLQNKFGKLSLQVTYGMGTLKKSQKMGNPIGLINCNSYLFSY